jgi:hypothetical protein
MMRLFRRAVLPEYVVRSSSRHRFALHVTIGTAKNGYRLSIGHYLGWCWLDLGAGDGV